MTRKFDPTLDGKPLTAREKEVLDLVGRGMSNLDIAAELRLSLNTIKTHMNRLLAKTGATSRHHLIVIAGKKYRANPEVVALIVRLRADRAAIPVEIGTHDWYRMEGELRVLDALADQITALPK